MGLDTSHDCWSGAYTAFFRWRSTLAKVAYGETHPTVVYYCNPMRGLISLADDSKAMYWPSVDGFSKENRDPLWGLLNHSDCDGDIPWQECGPLADRLEGLLPKLEGLVESSGHIGSYVEKTKKFIAGLRSAAKLQQNVEFH